MICSKKQLGGLGCSSSATPEKLCNFYRHLSLQTVFLALKLPQICYIMTIGSPTKHIYPVWKTILTKYESKGKKSRFVKCLVNWEKLGSIPKSQFSISSMNSKKLKIPARTTFKNSNLWIGKNLEVQPNSKNQKSQFEIYRWIEKSYVLIYYWN